MKKSTPTTSSEELDLRSPHFDPRRALYEKVENITGLAPNAPIYDNLSCFVETEKGVFPRERRLPVKNVASVNSPKSRITSATETTSHEQKDTIKPMRKKMKTVLTRMDSAKGPQSFLKKCMDEKLRIQVVIRGAVHVRGTCIGFLEAFDRHWNLILRDVTESWTRRKRHIKKLSGPVRRNTSEEPGKKPAQEDESNQLTGDRRPSALHKYDIQEGRKTETDRHRKPKIIVRKREKRKITYERHLDKILIRGEQIVLVKQPSM